MAGYSGTPLWKKLGYKAGVSAYVEGEPSNYISLLTLPADVVVTWLPRAKSDMEFVPSVRDVCFPAEKQTGIRPEKDRSWRSDLGLLAEEEFRGDE
jgi:hypothetical protein